MLTTLFLNLGYLPTPGLVIHLLTADVGNLYDAASAVRIGIASLGGQDVRRAIRQRQFSVIPLLSQRITGTVDKLATAGLLSMFAWNHGKPIVQAVWFFMTAKPMDVEQKRAKRAKLKELQDKLPGIQSNIDDNKVELAKPLVSLWCADWFAATLDLENVLETEEAQQIIAGFGVAALSMKEILRKLAKKIEPKEQGQIVDNTPSMTLNAWGMRPADLGDIVYATCGLDEDDGSILSLKMAEKQLFSKQDVRALFKECRSKEDQKQVLIDHLGRRQESPGVLDKLPLERITAIASRMDRALAPIFAGLVLGTGLISTCKFLRDGNVRVVAVSLLDELYFAYYGGHESLAISSFTTGSWADRCIWMLETPQALWRVLRLVKQSWQAKGRRVQTFRTSFHATFVGG